MVYTFDSSMTGAPVLSGTAGALRAVLKACMVDGFGAGAVATLTVAAGIATASFAGAHPYRIGTIAQFGGATPAGLNGQKRILSTTASAVTFDATGIADGTATGTITHKVAAAGWQELFAGSVTNVLCLKPTVVEATGCVLRVDDTGTISARVVGYESMSDANTGVGAFPNAAQLSGGAHWAKSVSAGVTPIAWDLVADDRAFYLCIAYFMGHNPGYVGRTVYFFGDFDSQKSGDAYNAALLGASLADRSLGSLMYRYAAPGVGDAVYVARSHTQVGGSVACGRYSAILAPTSSNADSNFSGKDAYCGTYPNAPSNGLIVSQVNLLEGTSVASASWRGTFPGAYHSPQKINPGTFSPGDRVNAEGVLAGRVLMAVTGESGSLDVGSLAATMFIDITGPWR